MTTSTVVRVACALAIVVCIVAQSTSVKAQQRGGTADAMSACALRRILPPIDCSGAALSQE
jgi:hypothetical protein